MTSSLIHELVREPGHLVCSRCPPGYDVLLSVEALRSGGGRALFVARDAREAAQNAALMAAMAPDIEVLLVPAWDNQPFDRMSPSASVAAQRTAALTRLLASDQKPLMVVASATALAQRTAPRAHFQAALFEARAGRVVPFTAIEDYLQRNGYERVPTVREAGEYAVRGGVVDIFSPQHSEPYRLDFFGDTLESVRRFDPASQRSTGAVPQLTLTGVSELSMERDSITRFRSAYRTRFGVAESADTTYKQLSEGIKAQGSESYLPFFHEKLETVFDLLGADPIIFLEHLAETAWQERDDLIGDLVEARISAAGSEGNARLIEREDLYIAVQAFQAMMKSYRLRRFSPFDDHAGRGLSIEADARPGRDFAPERQRPDINLFDSAAKHMAGLRESGKRVILASWTEGSSERTGAVMADHGLALADGGHTLPEAMARARTAFVRVVLPLDHGFETDDLAIITEQDILGDRLSRPTRKRKAASFISEIASLSQGDLVVHVDHGIGRFRGLKTVDLAGASLDCLDIEYAGGDTLLLPATNIELLSRYGSDNPNAPLDRMGGAGWQARKAKAKKRLRDMAGELIKLAAERELRKGDLIDVPKGEFDEFAARFPYVETDDQLNSIEDVIGDLQSGRPMDRLICGDVGFGKTEVALRAAFAAAMNGKQVAVICPTTLLARQHFRSFDERFRGWPVRVRQLSRLVSTKDASAVRTGLKDGTVDIVIGTHALLAKTIGFRDLGLLIIDEEQHFGVRHKERLKALKADVHVLTLTATPIPRTLQMSLSGLRDLSIIATPPVDRLAVRTYVAPFDTVTIREALLRERYRGGQSFFVVPRLSDLPDVEEFLKERVPELDYIVATGQLSPGELEDRIAVFYEGKCDVLLSTPIVESGLDIPKANTLVVWRADRFGLAQLYQLRGRVGRSKLRAFAYLTTPADWKMTDAAEKRLKVLLSLDELGAGFTLASHDLDMRGGGNLLGEEQSGHIRDVGVELFQQMLEDAIQQARDLPDAERIEDDWAPRINLGVSVLIPEVYVPDLDLRLSLYRRVSQMVTQTEREGFAAELIDRFGPLPEEVDFLLSVLEIKNLCRRLGIEKLDGGEKGAVAQFRQEAVKDVSRLIGFIQAHGAQFKLRPDGALVIRGDWPSERARVKGVLKAIAKLAGGALAESVSEASM
jgi:transcription-repair coupling factor (superfamily II helicase)